MTTVAVKDITEGKLERIKTTCAYCGVGCGIVANVDRVTGEIGIEGDQEHPANFGRLCSKGSALGETLALDQRALHPTVDKLRVSWDHALDFTASKLSKIIETYGADAVMFYVSGQLLTEDYYVANKLMKGFIGSNNIDSNSRLCMSSAVAGYLRAFGSDTVPTCYEDIESSDLFIIVGSNMAWCHPVLFQRLKAAKEQDGKKVVVIDPRQTDSCAIADYHLAIKPGTDAALFNGLLAYLDREGFSDASYLGNCDGVDAALNAVQAFDSIKKVADYCEISEGLIERFFEDFAKTRKTVSFYSMGVNQSSSGTDKVNALINCHLFTGKIGYSGAGPFSITGQPNAMGGREVGALANLLASHLSLSSKDDRKLLQKYWQTEKTISPHVGVKAAEAAKAMQSGKIKAIWIMATNPVVSLPEADEFAKGLAMCELVIVSDCSKQSDTAQYANVFFPAQGWSEKSGTVTNSERRISRQRRLLEPAGEAKADWWIMKELAQRLGYEGFDYVRESDIFQEHARLSGFENDGARSFDISGLADISQRQYDDLAPIQWPIFAREDQTDKSSARFFGGQLEAVRFYHNNKKARLIPIQPRLPQSKKSRRFPLVLNTGRIRDQWHTMTRTGMSPRLNQHLAEPFALVHPEDLKRYDINADQLMTVRSNRETITVRAVSSEGQRLGEVFVPMHWNNSFSSNARVGKLIAANVCPVSSQPEFKYTPIAVAPVKISHSFCLLASIDAWQQYSSLIDRAKQSSEQIYWAQARQAGAYECLMELDIKEQASIWLEPFLQRLKQSINEDSSSHLSFTKVSLANDTLRFAVFSHDELVMVGLFGKHDSLPKTSWLREQFGRKIEFSQRAAILAAQPSEGVEDVGQIVCACFTVGEKTLQKVIEDGCQTADAVGERLKAGTNCGSCIPHINKLIAAAG